MTTPKPVKVRMNEALRGSSEFSSDRPPRYHAIFSCGFLRCYIVTMRPYLLFISGITGAAGLSLSNEYSVPKILLYSIIFFFSYGFGQALTDCSQLDTDTISAPYRPLVRGSIRTRDVIIASLAGLGLSGFILAAASSINIVLALLAVIGLATYTFFKRRWWGGPPYNAAIVAILCLMGYEAGMNSTGSAASNLFALTATIMAAFFGYSNFVLTGYFKDISADRKSGYNTLPVAFGMKVSATVSDILAGLTVSFSALAIYLVLKNHQHQTGSWFCIGIAAPGLISAILGQIKLHKIRDENLAYKAIALVVHSYILLLSAIVMAARPNWIIPIFYGLFLLAMKYRPEKRQI